MKKRIVYLLLTVIVLGIEIFIGVFVKDNIIRPFLGDVLVAVLLCLALRVILLEWKWLPVAVFGFSFAIELTQLIRLDRLLGLDGTVAGVILGSTFDILDIFCYLLGCVLFAVTEYIILNKLKQ